jgi:hypothetical protein
VQKDGFLLAAAVGVSSSKWDEWVGSREQQIAKKRSRQRVYRSVATEAMDTAVEMKEILGII